VAPGELWLVEHAVAARASAFERALTSANVIIYDRVLEGAVAALLPIGGYAEPASGDVVGRCIRLVRDGWRVARIVERPATSADFSDLTRGLAARLRAAGAPPELDVRALVNIDASGFESTKARLAEIEQVIGRIGDGTSRAIVFGPFAPSIAPHLHLLASNGLAG